MKAARECKSVSVVDCCESEIFVVSDAMTHREHVLLWCVLLLLLEKKRKKGFWLLTLVGGWFNNMPNREYTGNKRWLCGQFCLASVKNDRFIVSETAHSATRCVFSCLFFVRMTGSEPDAVTSSYQRCGAVRFRLWDCVIGNSLLILNLADGNLLTQTSCWQQPKQAFIAPEHS